MHKDQHKTLFSKFKQISVHYFVLTKELEPRRPELSENFGKNYHALITLLKVKRTYFQSFRNIHIPQILSAQSEPYISLSSFLAL